MDIAVRHYLAGSEAGMNSRQRVIGALERREIDRVPVHLSCGGPNSAVDTLLAHFRAKDRNDLLLTMEIDTRSVSPQYVGPSGQAPIGNELGTETVFGGSEYIKCDFEGSGGIAGTYADDLGSRPFKHFTTVSEIENYAWPKTEWFDFSSLKEDCRQYGEYAIMYGGWSPVISRVFELFGMEKALLYFHDRPDLIHATIERSIDYYYALYDTALQAAEGGIQIIGFGDDFATQRNLLLSPAMWRAFCVEPLSRLFSLGKKHGVYVFFHSCGAVKSIIPDLIEIGLDILFPIQPNAWGMDHRELKAEFGDRLAFWGGIDVQRLLPFGTPEQVRRYVRERIDILGAGGGYILSSSHNLLKAFPLENILAMYDEALKTA
jgi:uroporphyrinogen decarboxylase